MSRNLPRVLTCVFSMFLTTACQCQKAIELFHKMQSALGGRAKIASVLDFEECIRGDGWNDSGKYQGVAYKRTRWINPDILRLDQVGASDYVLFFNGTSGWEILPDKGFAELTGDELRFAQGYANGVDVRVWLADGSPDTIFTSSGEEVISILRQGDALHRTDITLDPTTFLPASESSISLADAKHPVATQTRQFEDWEGSQGVEFPRRIINFHRGTKVADLRVLELEINSRMRLNDLAIKPQDQKPQMYTCGGQ